MTNPDRSNVFLVNLTHRPFVDGTGPLPPRRTAGVARAMSILMKIALAIGAAVMLWALIARDTFYLYGGLVFVALAGMFIWIGTRLRNQKRKEDELDARGVLLDAELVKASVDNSDNTADNLLCRYRFTTPSGTLLTGKTSGMRKDINKKNLPPPGTPLVVLYLDDTNFEAL